MTYRRLSYRPTDTVVNKVNYSRTPTKLYDVGYDVSLKDGSTEVFYFAGKKCHSQATEAAMKELKGCVVLDVKLKR